jgi:3-oxoacyl-[acyl-carrier protein] reductase
MKTIVVTGASKGLGLEITRQLLAADYQVVGISRSSAPSDVKNNADFTEEIFDLSNTAGIPGLCDRIVRGSGVPYGLVNNSALGLDGLLATQKNEDIELVISVNLTAVILLTKYFSRHMLERREGRVINISSIVASTGYRGLSVYAATKAALLGFTRSLSRELGPRNITVNSIQPGFMETAMSEGIPDPQMAKIKRRAALGRFPDLEDVASAVFYLIGDSGKNITGQSIVIDAGNSA